MPPAHRCLHLALLLAALALGGCASTGSSPLSTATIQEMPERVCVRAAHAAYLPTAADSAGEPEAAQVPARHALPFSRTALATAAAIGVLPALNEIVAANASPASSASREQALLARQALMERITLTMLDVASVTGEIDCENERSGQLRDQLQRLEEQRLRGLTVAGLVIGAATAIVSGGIALYDSDAVAASVINVVGGAAQAGTGFAALTYTPAATLRHERNLLADLWEGKPDSTLFPPSIWRFLTQVREEDTGVPLGQALVEQWRAGERLGPRDSQEEQRRAALIFGKGGNYTADDLRARDAILDQLEATVKLLYQDLGLLMRELSAWTATRATAGSAAEPDNGTRKSAPRPAPATRR